MPEVYGSVDIVVKRRRCFRLCLIDKITEELWIRLQELNHVIFNVIRHAVPI